MSLQHEATKTRALVRQYALSSPEKRVSTKSSILTALENLGEEAGSNRSAEQMSNAALSFQTRVHKVLQAPGKDTRSLLLKACDEIRCVFYIFCGNCSHKLNILFAKTMRLRLTLIFSIPFTRDVMRDHGVHIQDAAGRRKKK